MVDKVRENRLRRMADRLGMQLQKSRARKVHVDNFGLYRLVDAETGAVVAGAKYDLEIDDVEDRLQAEEEALRRQAGGGDDA